MFATPLRRWTAPLINQVAHQLIRLGISANVITTLTLVLGLAAAGCVLLEAWLSAAALWGVSCLCDGLDGAVARASKRASPFGKFFDSTTDKVTEVTLYMALAWRVPALHWPVMWVMAGFLLSGYLGKSAQVTGLSRPTGLLERLERALGLTLVVLTLALGHVSLAYGILAAMALGCAWTFGQRVWYIAGHLREAPHPSAQRISQEPPHGYRQEDL